jgi:glutaminyl-peptide cyclotransferase
MTNFRWMLNHSSFTGRDVDASVARIARALVVTGILLLLWWWGPADPQSPLAAADRNRSVPVDTYEVVARYPHDPQAFCQGLVVRDGVMFEGTGQNGRSSLREVELKTGRVLREMELNREYFGEGVCWHGDRLFQLTWKNRVAFEYNARTLEVLAVHRYSGEGWGLTSDGESLILSDGSSTLRYLDPRDFRVQKKLKVTANGRPLEQLNELEFIDGEIWANIWYSDRVARISPKTGEVVGWVDFTGLWPAAQRPNHEAVLNGIAYDTEQKKLYVTGKNWPRLFEVRLVRQR